VGVTLPEDVVRREVENATASVPAHEDIDSLIQKVTRLEGELAEAHRAREVAEGVIEPPQK
jgi:hypothetical protein